MRGHKGAREHGKEQKGGIYRCQEGSEGGFRETEMVLEDSERYLGVSRKEQEIVRSCSHSQEF